MKSIIFILIACISFVASYGAPDCAAGPAAWCTSLRQASACGALQHCTTAIWTQNEFVVPDDGDVCQFCEQIIGDAKKFLLANETEQQLRDYLDASCKAIPVPELADICKEAVNINLDQLFDLIKQDVDPKVICSLIGLCGSFEVVAERPVPQTTVASETLTTEAPAPPTHVPGDLCVDCKKLVTDLEATITAETTEKEIKDMLKSLVCTWLGPEKQLCDEIVDKYTPQLLAMLVQQIPDADCVCSVLGLCSGGKGCLMKYHNAKYTAAKDGEVCQFCEQIIGATEKFLLANDTEKQIRDYLDASCSVIPVPELADICRTAINTQLDQLFDMIKQEADPKTVCYVIGLCTGAKNRPPAVTPKATKALTGDICEDCKHLIDDIKAEVTANTTQKEVEDLLKSQVCAMLGPVQEACDQIVEEFTPELIDMLVQQIPDAGCVCGMLGLCGPRHEGRLMLIKHRLASTPLYSALQQAVDTSDECIFCKIVLEDLQELDRNAEIQEQIEDFLQNFICAKLGGFAEVCSVTVVKYGRELFELLATEFEPTARCQALGFCPTPNQVSVMAVMRAAMPISKPTATAPIPEQLTSVGGIECVLCEKVMGYLKKYVLRNATESRLVAELETVCGKLPTEIAAQCDDFVQLYGKAVIEMALAEVAPEQMCALLELCTTAKPRHVKDGKWCGICEVTIQYLDDLLQANRTQAQIEAALEKVCHFLPDTIKETCDALVEQYMQQIVDLVLQELTPKEVCSELGLCSAMEAPIVSQKVPLLGINPCTYGPAYWCKSHEIANECKMLDHCLKKGLLKK